MANYNNSSEMRPFSDNLVDLHISVVPMNHWVEKLNYASHKVIGDTFSAGFIRVLPETSIAMLRQEISEQLGGEMFPEDYVFLKHVGRCLALIRQSQEKELKVKHFLPPHSIMPEVFILPGQPAMYTYKVLPPIQPRLHDLHISLSDHSGSTTNLKTNESVNRSLRTKSPYKYNDADLASRSSTNSPELNNVPLGQPFNPFRGENRAAKVHPKANRGVDSPSKTRIPSSVQRRELKRQQRHVSGKSNYDIEIGQTVRYSYEQERYQSGGEDNVVMQKVSQSLPEETTPSLAKSVLREGPKKRRVRYNMPPQSNASSQDNEMAGGVDLPPAHVLSHSHPDHRRFVHHSSGSDSSLHSNSLERHGQEPPNQFEMNLNRDSRVRKQFIDTSSHAFSNPSNHSLGSNQNHFVSDSNPVTSPSPIAPTPPTPDTVRRNPASSFATGNPHPDSYPTMPPTKPQSDPPAGEKWEGRDLIKSSSANNDSGYVEHELSESDEYFFKDKHESSSLQKTGEGVAHREDMDHDDGAVSEDDIMRDQSDPLQRSSPVSPATLVPQFKQADFKQEESANPGLSLPQNDFTSESAEITELPSSPDVQTEKRLGSPARARLWEELQKVRAERRRAEKQRQELVQQAKVITSRMNHKRSLVRDTWKKKFFEEKKKTLPLEDTCRRLQAELDSTHRRLVTALESNKPTHHQPLKKLPPILPPPVFAPSVKIRRKSLRSLQKNNNKIQATRLQHDMDGLRRNIEDAKIKLTGEIKLRHQAEQDVKTVRQELLTKKIRAHVAYRELSRKRTAFPIKA